MSPYRNNILPYTPAPELAGPHGGASQDLPGHGASWWGGSPSRDTGPQKRWRPRAGKLQLHWSSTAVEHWNWSVCLIFWHFFYTFLGKSSQRTVLSNFIYRKTNIKHFQGIPSQTLMFTSVNLGFCFSRLLVKKGLWRIPLWDLYFIAVGAIYPHQPTTISFNVTYPLTRGELLLHALLAVTAISITLFCKFCILHIPLLTRSSSSARSCKQTAAFAAPRSGTLLQITEGRYVY